MTIDEKIVNWIFSRTHFFSSRWLSEKFYRGIIRKIRSLGDLIVLMPDLLNWECTWKVLKRSIGFRLACLTVISDVIHESFLWKRHVTNRLSNIFVSWNSQNKTRWQRKEFIHSSNIDWRKASKIFRRMCGDIRDFRKLTKSQRTEEKRSLTERQPTGEVQFPFFNDP